MLEFGVLPNSASRVTRGERWGGIGGGILAVLVLRRWRMGRSSPGASRKKLAKAEQLVFLTSASRATKRFLPSGRDDAASVVSEEKLLARSMLAFRVRGGLEDGGLDGRELAV